jgi:hypothetical protein
VTRKALIPAPSRPPKNPCSGRPYGKTSASAIGRIAAVKETGDEADHHEHWYGMARGDAEHSRHQSILELASLASQPIASSGT